MLARLLVISGPAYMKKFIEKTGGMVIMQHRLKRWWNIPTIWPICFAIFFGQDVADINLERKFDLYNLLEIFDSKGKVKIACPEVLPVLTGMLRNGLKSIMKEQADPGSPVLGATTHSDSSSLDPAVPQLARVPSVSIEGSSGLSLPFGIKFLCFPDMRGS